MLRLAELAQENKQTYEGWGLLPGRYLNCVDIASLS
jgi:hypothetical protein